MSTIINVDLGDEQWLQASLPVKNSGLGIRSAQMMAPSAFMPSAAWTRALQVSILPGNVKHLKEIVRTRKQNCDGQPWPEWKPDHRSTAYAEGMGWIYVKEP